MRKAGDVVSALFGDQFGPDFMKTAKSSAGLFSSWENIISEIWPAREEEEDEIPAAAIHSRIRELEKGVLLVEADHPGWVQILRTKQGELLSVVQHRYPELDIRAIAFRLSRTPKPDLTTGEYKTQAVKNEQEVRESNVYKNTESTPETAFGSAGDRDSHQVKIKTKNEDFYAALKGLEESMRKRNRNSL